MDTIQKAAAAALMNGRGGMLPTATEQIQAKKIMDETGLSASDSLTVAAASQPLNKHQEIFLVDIMADINRDFDREP